MKIMLAAALATLALAATAHAESVCHPHDADLQSLNSRRLSLRETVRLSGNTEFEARAWMAENQMANILATKCEAGDVIAFPADAGQMLERLCDFSQQIVHAPVDSVRFGDAPSRTGLIYCVLKPRNERVTSTADN